MTWDGTNYAPSYCFSNLGIDVACNEPVCLPVGSYEARLCAQVNQAGTPDMCQASADQVCTDVNFEFEGGEIVVAGEINP
jgi:hypothetical protein